MQQRRVPAVLHLVFDGGEVGLVLHVLFADVEHRETALLEACRHLPVVVTSDKQPDVIVHPDHFLALVLDRVLEPGHEVLQLALGALVTRPERLVGVQQEAAVEVSIEAGR